MLNEQLQNELDQEAKAEAKKLTGRVPIFRMGYEAGHYDGAEKYAEKWQSEVVERSEARKLLDEVMRKHEAGLLPDRFVYEKIKAFLTHKTGSDGTDK